MKMVLLTFKYTLYGDIQQGVGYIQPKIGDERPFHHCYFADNLWTRVTKVNKGRKSEVQGATKGLRIKKRVKHISLYRIISMCACVFQTWHKCEEFTI